MLSPTIKPISVNAAVERTGLAERTLRKYIANGRLTKYTIAGTRRIALDAAEVDALIQLAPVKTA